MVVVLSTMVQGPFSCKQFLKVSTIAPEQSVQKVPQTYITILHRQSDKQGTEQMQLTAG